MPENHEIVKETGYSVDAGSSEILHENWLPKTYIKLDQQHVEPNSSTSSYDAAIFKRYLMDPGSVPNIDSLLPF